VRTVLAGRDCIGVMPTGAGKSLAHDARKFTARAYTGPRTFCSMEPRSNRAVTG
jgi:hypothetical protein